jgi:aryl-alcohol dehydrogenase-like predicted oxidoreductase
MEYRRLGRSGLDVSVLGYGATSYESVEQATELIRECLNHGITFFDCAEAYSNGEAERIFGEALRILQVPRRDIVVSTKLFKVRLLSTINGNYRGVSVMLRSFWADLR